MSAPIFVSQGFSEYRGATVTEMFGKDISADTMQLGLGSYDSPPATWRDPDTDAEGATVASRVVSILIGAESPLGTWWLWVTVADNPEFIPIRVPGDPVVTA